MQQDVFHIITFQRQGLSAGRDAPKQRGFTCSAANTEWGVCLHCSNATGGMSSSPWPGSDTGAPPAMRDTRITSEHLWWEMSSRGVTQLLCFPVCRGKKEGILKLWKTISSIECLTSEKKKSCKESSQTGILLHCHSESISHVPPVGLCVFKSRTSTCCLPAGLGWGCVCWAGRAFPRRVAMNSVFMAAQCILMAEEAEVTEDRLLC